MHKKVIAAIFLSVSFMASTTTGSAQKKTQAAKEPFKFIAFGDMPYFVPEDFQRFEHFIRFVNIQDQSFNVFVGDIKSSRTDCSNDLYYKIFDYFEQFKKPLIYTPGDNEWTDCERSLGEKYDPLERLDFLRTVFFKEPNYSLGQEKMKLIAESSDQRFKKYVENKRWEQNNVSFATIHIVGSNNNFDPQSRRFTNEYFERSDADSFWLAELFKNAKLANNIGVVIFVHADMFMPYPYNHVFLGFLEKIKAFALDFKKPVLLVHGDSHKFIIDKPLVQVGGKTILNFTRVQVFGELDMHAVQVTVNPDNPQVFEIQELIVPEEKP